MSAPGGRPAGAEDKIARLLHAEWCDVGRCYWLPADPAPIRCDTIADVVREYRDLCDREAREQRAQLTAARAEADALRGAWRIAEHALDLIAASGLDCAPGMEPEAHYRHAAYASVGTAARALRHARDAARAGEGGDAE